MILVKTKQRDGAVEGDGSGTFGITLAFGDGDELCPVKDTAQNSGRLEC